MYPAHLSMLSAKGYCNCWLDDQRKKRIYKELNPRAEWSVRIGRYTDLWSWGSKLFTFKSNNLCKPSEMTQRIDRKTGRQDRRTWEAWQPENVLISFYSKMSDQCKNIIKHIYILYITYKVYLYFINYGCYVEITLKKARHIA